MNSVAQGAPPVTGAPAKALAPWLVMLAMIGSAACWGLATVMSRELLAVMTSPCLLVIQLSASVLALTLMSCWTATPLRDGRQLLRASWVGLLEPGLTFTVSLIGLSATRAGIASVLGAAEPIFIVVVAWVLFRQAVGRRLLLSLALASGGLVPVSGEAWADSDHGAWTGNLLVMLGALFAASYVVISARTMAEIPATTLAAAQQAVGLVFALLVLLVAQLSGLHPQDWTDLGARTMLYAAMSGLVQYALSFWLYLVGLRHLSAGSAGLWLALVPVFGLLGSYIWLGEVPSLMTLGGAAIIIAATVLGRKQDRPG
jgi:drug/metabolite transporter (DMT)-like permease